MSFTPLVSLEMTPITGTPGIPPGRVVVRCGNGCPVATGVTQKQAPTNANAKLVVVLTDINFMRKAARISNRPAL